MTNEIDILRKAISRVDTEQSQLRAERCALHSFREAFGSIPPDSADNPDDAEASDRVLDAYRDHVIDGVDIDAVYGESEEEFLLEEFPPSVAYTVLGKELFTQRRKRNLLLAISGAVELRVWLLAELDIERDALESYLDELSEIGAAIDELPEISVRSQSLERLVVFWKEYDSLEKQCECLLDRRQQQLSEVDRIPQISTEGHAWNGYLYSELNSPYPVFSVLGATLERIESRRESKEPTAVDRSLER